MEALDEYLVRQSSQDVARRVAACFVLTRDGNTIAGYYTLSRHSIGRFELPPEIAKKLPRYPQIPATLLGRFAIDERFRGNKLGEFLLMNALQRSLDHSRVIASIAVIVDAKNDNARRFYLHFHFLPFIQQPNRLFLPMTTIEKLFAR